MLETQVLVLPTPMNRDVVIYKRYKNRKIYNTITKRYVSLSQIYDSFNDGEFFKIYSAKNEDITKDVLLSSIMEKTKTFNNVDFIILLEKVIKYLGGLYE